jgi:hypothetical protein
MPLGSSRSAGVLGPLARKLLISITIAASPEGVWAAKVS